MAIQVIIFGQLADVLQNHSLQLTGVADTGSLVRELNSRYPGFANAKYVIAVDKKTVSGNVQLSDGSTVALLPPFSGG
jgi:molybdopterin converting factor small subunit